MYQKMADCGWLLAADGWPGASVIFYTDLNSMNQISIINIKAFKSSKFPFLKTLFLKINLSRNVINNIIKPYCLISES